MISTVGTAPNRNIDQIQLVLNLFKCPSSGDSATLSSSRCSGTGNDFKYRTVGAAVANYLGNGGTLLTDGAGPNVPTGLFTAPVNEGGQAGSANPGTLEVQISSQVAGAGVLDNGGVLFEDSRIKISDISDGTTNTALIAEHYGATCLTGGGIGNTNCSSGNTDSCFAYWANSDGIGGGARASPLLRTSASARSSVSTATPTRVSAATATSARSTKRVPKSPCATAPCGISAAAPITAC